MGLPVMGDNAPRFCGPAAGPERGAGAAVPGSGPGRAAAPAGGVGATERARATGTAGCARPGAALIGEEAAAPVGVSLRTCGAVDVADGTTGAAGPDGRAGLPAETGAEVPVVCAPVDAATTPGGGGTRPWPEDETTGDGPAGIVLPGATVPGVPRAAPSALAGAIGAGAAGAGAGRVPAETWFVGSTPAGGTGAVPVAARPLPATPASAAPASEPAEVTGAVLPARGEVGVAAEPGEEERPAPGAGRSCSAAGSSG
ncbi:MAG: hypothetical protein ABSE77_00435 [Acidimicrobiales bacterium]|jgi:hypothetical protein